MADSLAYVSAPGRGVFVYDVRNPAGIQQVAFYSSPEYLGRIQATNGLIYLAGGNAGLNILKYSPIIGRPIIMDGMVNFSINGLPDQTVMELESSTNLVEWSTILTNISTVHYEFATPIESNVLMRYYRAVAK